MTARREGDFELLIPYYRGKAHWEADKAASMFRKFVSDEFSYDDIANHPDYMVYASAEVLARILPLMIDEMVTRADTGNFLIYHVIAAVDPFGEGKAWTAERTEELVKLLDKKTADKIYKLIAILRTDPPVPIERLDRILAFWKNKTSPSPS